MKVYDVNELYSVVFKKDNTVYSHICTYLNGEYRDYKTKELVNSGDCAIVNSLKGFAEVFGVQYFTEGIIVELVEYFKALGEKLDFSIDSILRRATDALFNLKVVYYDLDTSDVDVNELDKRFILYNLNDCVWLAQMLIVVQRLSIGFDKVLNYVKTSEYFKRAKFEFERKVVFGKINDMLQGGEYLLNDPTYCGMICVTSDVWDKAFRQGVIDTLTWLQIDKETIEEVLELKADCWRDQVMARTFSNIYEVSMPSINIRNILYPKSINSVSLAPVDSEFREKWLQYRRYEYYKDHKESVDKYGVVTPDMLLSDEEANELKAYLAIKESERLMEIEDYKKKKRMQLSLETPELKRY